MDLKKYKPTLPETARLWRRMLYNKIENIFIYENLPEEIPVRFFNLCLFKTGKMVFYKIGDKFCVQPFTYTDILNWYYVPVSGRVVNPYLPKANNNWEFTIDDEAVIYNSSADIYNARPFSVVADLIWKTANQLSENDISYYCISRNTRLLAILTAETDLQKREMDRILDKMYRGETDITMEENLVSHIRANPLTQNSTRNTLTELIEFQQYILANFYHSFGINSNYNLKREQLNSDEIDVNQEVLRLNIEDMLKNREDGVSKINKKYGLDITVSLNEKLYATLLQLTQQILNPNDPNQTSMEERVLNHENSAIMAQQEETKNDRIFTSDGNRSGRTDKESSVESESPENRGLGKDETRGNNNESSSGRNEHSVAETDNKSDNNTHNNEKSVDYEQENVRQGESRTASGNSSDNPKNDETTTDTSTAGNEVDFDGDRKELENTPIQIIINAPTKIKTEENENDDKRTTQFNEET